MIRHETMPMQEPSFGPANPFEAMAAGEIYVSLGAELHSLHLAQVDREGGDTAATCFIYPGAPE